MAATAPSAVAIASSKTQPTQIRSQEMDLIKDPRTAVASLRRRSSGKQWHLTDCAPQLTLNSTSYGYNEHDLSPFYERRQCAEYLKLGLMGVSVLYSSGDYGVAGNGGQCIAADGTYNNGHSGRFNPAFPSTCPWVTSVGATQVKPHISLPNAIASGTEPEKACETVIFSGGGFSNVFPLPGYQSKAVKSFFTNYPPPYTSAQYNNSQVTRGYPDISANGANYVVAVDGQFSLVYGTSASSPTLGSILTLINEERFAKGLSSIGFVNPVAYKHPDVGFSSVLV